MHKLYRMGDEPKDYDFAEYCPHCESFTAVVIDQEDKEHYEFKCPHCGERLMLCTLCQLDHGNTCDWCHAKGCSRMKRGE